jgi:hypothetical protein
MAVFCHYNFLDFLEGHCCRQPKLQLLQLGHFPW